MAAFCQLLLLFVLLAVLIENATSYCLSVDSNPYPYYSTKTSYDSVRGTAGSDSTCNPVQIWLLNRHGTRYASNSTLKDMKAGVDLKMKILENYSKGLVTEDNRLCEKDLAALATWEWDDSIESYGNYLTTEGWRELVEIAERYQRRYPELMSTYENGSMYFRHTVEQRTHASCRAFIQGLFGRFEDIPIDEPMENDPVIRPYKKCNAWIKEVDENDDFRKAEKRIFRKEADYLRLVANVSRRLGFEKDLKKIDIDVMYDLCRYSAAWFPNTTSPWCAIFKKQEAFLLEFHEDLGLYYKSGYGHEYNPKLGCKAVQNLLETFEDTIRSNGAMPKGVFYFSHDTMVNMMMVALGYNKDDQPLKGKNYQDQLVSRKFRSSISTPFAANIAAVLHKCTNDYYQIQFFNNERPMELEGCPQGLCPWEHFRTKFAFAKHCNIDFCDN